MVEPRIQYAKTKDGVNVAFYALGEGMPDAAAKVPDGGTLPPTSWNPDLLEFDILVF